MVYLALAMISSMLISVLMRLGERYSRSSMGMLAMNYLMCSVLSGAFIGSAPLFPQGEGLALTLGLGGIGGVLFLAAFVLLQWNISKNGVVLPATFMKLGVIVPTLLAITVFGETPRWTQILGIAAAIGAIFLIQGEGKKEARSAGGLVLLLIGGGSADAMSKVFEAVGPAAMKNHFLLYTFAMAMVLCAALCLLKKQRLCAADVLFGLAIGVPNYFSARFLLLSLEQIPAVVAYPSFSVGTIVLTALVGMLLFGEKLSRRKITALGVILAALALLNL